MGISALNAEFCYDVLEYNATRAVYRLRPQRDTDPAWRGRAPYRKRPHVTDKGVTLVTPKR